MNNLDSFKKQKEEFQKQTEKIKEEIRSGHQEEATETLNVTLSVANKEGLAEALEDIKQKADQLKESVDLLDEFGLKLEIKH